ncbi:glycoside hydrolase family 10 protein [Streptomyces gobiensis]|uniref:glycoside hydrolase family 10 protein n=1 Tax=Streptomyces gobiensis TaxID=2875706 RepID=UPI001E3DF856|nr:family 10 glycosylhydrolase [Streptomyces gobiensis]UGY90458.1 family 10 glycosylhydrolase [Streptomyces gobiensis]
MVGRITRRAFSAVAVGALSGTLAASAASARGGPGRKTGMRGVWLATVANIDWPSMPGLDREIQQRQLLTHLDTVVERRLNTVVFQVRSTADAMWPSRFEPWAEYLTGEQGKDPGWDPLGFAVSEAHARGLELHAWFNPYRVANHDDPSRLVADHPARRHPEWVVPYGGKLYYNPGLPEVRRFVQDAMFDAVERYDIDAVHWDDYFYPYPVAGEEFDDAAAYEEHGGDFDDRGDWRRHNIDLLVRESSWRLKATKPQVRFGISPFAIWRNKATDPAGSDTTAGVQTYDDLYADTRSWVRRRWIDYIVPQVYWHMGFEPADYTKLVPWWSQVAKGTGVDLYIGEALYKVADPAQPKEWHDPDELSRHLTFCRDFPQVRGNIFFSAKGVASNPIGAMAKVVEDHYQRPGPRG